MLGAAIMVAAETRPVARAHPQAGEGRALSESERAMDENGYWTFSEWVEATVNKIVRVMAARAALTTIQSSPELELRLYPPPAVG